VALEQTFFTPTAFLISILSLPPPPNCMSRKSFKMHRKGADQAKEVSKGQIFQLDKTGYHEGITLSGSSHSTSTFVSALPLPPQPLPIKQPPPPVVSTPTKLMSEATENPPLKKKTQVHCGRQFTRVAMPLTSSHRLLKPFKSLPIHFLGSST